MQALETPNEEAERAALVVTMDDFKARLSAADYRSIADSLGYSETGPWRNWDIFGSSYYVFTLVTTVGYGSFGASTESGKVFTIFCTFFGIPIFAYVSVTTGHALFDLLAGPYFHWLDRHTRILFGNALGDLSPNKQNAYSVQPEKLPNIASLKAVLNNDPIVGPEIRFLQAQLNGFFDLVDDGDGEITAGELRKVLTHIIDHLVYPCTDHLNPRPLEPKTT